jgi:hypothetical protein
MKINLSSNLDNLTYALSGEVYLIPLTDNAYLVDLGKGKFYALDGMAYIMLSSVLERGKEATLEEITQTYDVTPEQARTDLNNLLENLIQKQLLNTPPPTSPWVTPLSKIITSLERLFPEPNYLLVNLLLILVTMSLRGLGWYLTLQIFKKCSQDKQETTNIGLILEKVDHLVREAAAAQLFFPVVCRERAIAGYYLLQAYYGIKAELVVGHNAYPFQIHAWVEYQDKIITDDPEHCQEFTEITRYG